LDTRRTGRRLIKKDIYLSVLSQLYGTLGCIGGVKSGTSAISGWTERSGRADYRTSTGKRGSGKDLTQGVLPATIKLAAYDSAKLRAASQLGSRRIIS
jgi:hypothetical protein